MNGSITVGLTNPPPGKKKDMENISHLLIRLYVGLTAPRRRTEDGDVPGWVLITVMTAGLVVGIWVFAETTLRDMLSNALNKVK